MSGRTDFFLHAVTLLSLIACATDLARGRIYNWLTLPAAVAGVVAATAAGGWAGLAEAVLGLLVGFAIYAWMFWIGVMGGGDVKLMAALGAWGGVRYALEVGLLGVLLGGLMAAALLATRGKLHAFARKMYRFLLTTLVKELAVEPLRIDRREKMPFGVAIAAAAVWVAAADPFVRWGWRLW